MKKNDAPIGKNRTGIELSPIDKREMLDIPALTKPPPGDETVLAEAREEFIRESDGIGSVPPPASVKGIAKTGLEAVKGVNAAVFIDKLGERLAFERTGTRLYEALVEKCDAAGSPPGGPSVSDLEELRLQELAHFGLVRDAMTKLGADPTAMTPSADVVAVLSTGILQVIDDARTSLKQSLEAMLVAELADNDGWTLLIELARTAGEDDLTAQFEAALRVEEEHLLKVRGWINRATIAAARPAAQVTV
jgi:hypothetical protein